MIQIKIPLMSTDKTIVRPIATSVVNDIKNIFSIDKDIQTAMINFIGESSDTETNITDKYIYLPEYGNNEKLEVEYEDIIDEDAIITTDINDPRSLPVVYDDEIDLVVKPIYVKGAVKLTIKYFMKSKSKATAILSNLKLKAAENSEMMLHDLKYFYYLPKGVGKLLIDILDRKNAILKSTIPKMTLEEYLLTISGKGLSGANAYVGLDNKIDLIVKEKQRQVLGFFNMDLVNTTKEKDEDRNGYTVNFTYVINYNKPIYLYVKYPIIVYNQLLPKGYVQRITLDKDKIDIDEYVAGYSDAYKYVKTEYLINKWYRNWHYVSIPYYDLHTLPKAPPYMLRVFVVLLNITLLNKKSLFNLKEIPGYTLHDDVLDYIKSYGNDIFRKPYSNVFNMTLYENRSIVDPYQLQIDENFNISSTKDLDIKKTYRMAFSVVVDWNVLSSKDRIKAKYNSTIGTRLIQFLRDDRDKAELEDDAIISIPEPELDKYVNGIYTTHIEAWLIDDIYEDKEKNKTIFDTEEGDSNNG